MANLNLCQFIGNVGKCETRATQGGEFITNVSMACNEKWKDKNGQQQERTEWVRVSFFGKLAEIAGEYAQKGKLIYVSGRMQTRKWQDKDGVEKYTTEIVADKLQLLGGKDDTGRESGSRNGGRDDYSRQPAAPVDDFSDDIPF